MESYCSLCTFKVPQGANNLILCTLNTIHRLFFVKRIIINQINKVQWVDFKLENVLVSLHSLKTMGLSPFGTSAPLLLRNGELLGHSPIRNERRINRVHQQFYLYTNCQNRTCGKEFNTTAFVNLHIYNIYVNIIL